MKTLVFHNNTVLEPAAFKYMGLSVKESDNTFGMFGTGLKYAIATLLRLGDSVEIITEGRRYFFTVEDMEFRGKKFQAIQCNGEDLGLTTELGKCWEAWMAYRELRCNAMDEGGGVALGEQSHLDATTRVVVRGDVLAEVHSQRSQWFLDDSRQPVWSNENVEVYTGVSNRYYYQGVAVGNCSVSPYTINFLSGISLSEDRLDSFSYSFTRKVGDFLQHCDHPDVLRAFLGSSKKDPMDGLAQELRFRMDSDVCPAFIQAARSVYKRTGKFLEGTKEFLTAKDKKTQDLILSDLDDLERKRVDNAIAFLELAGCNISKYTIKKIQLGSRKLLGRAEDDTIILTKEGLSRGTYDLALTILEEFAHCESGAADFTREFQDYLFRMIISQMEARTGIVL